MQTVKLTSIPNQSFDVYVGGIRYDFRLHTFRDMLYADVSVGDTDVSKSIRCIDRTWLIPYDSRNAGNGNFRFEDSDEGFYVNWERFGIKCFLRYYTTDEIAELED